MPQIIVEVGINRSFRSLALQRPQTQPLSREVLHQLLRAWIGKHAPHLLLEHFGIFQFSLPGEVDELVVGAVAPQKKGQARGQLQIADPIGFAGLDAGGSSFGAEHKFRMREDELQRSLDAVFKIAVFPAGPVKTQQGRGIRVSERSAVRLARQCAENRFGARQGVASRGRGAYENLPAAGCVLRRQAVDRTLDGDLAHLRRLHDALDRVIVQDAPPVRAVQENMRNISVRDKRETHRVLAGLDHDANLVLVGLDIGSQRYVLTDRVQLDPPAVDGEFDLLILGVAAVQRADGVPHGHPRDDVLSIGREVVMDKHPAPRAERQTIDLFFLRIILAGVVNLPARSRFMTQRLPAQF